MAKGGDIKVEISRQIKEYRLKLHLSQEDLAAQIFVTRQTISNWENARNYPDINSLVMLSALFDISLDILIKGDLEKMKEEIKTEDIKKLNRDSGMFFALLIVTAVSCVPLLVYTTVIGILLWVILVAATMYYAMRLEKQKRHTIFRHTRKFWRLPREKDLTKSRKPVKAENVRISMSFL